MIAKLEDLNFSVSGEILNVSANVAVYADDGTTVLWNYGVSAKGNFNDPNIKANIIAKLQQAAQYIVDEYKNKMAVIQSFYPTASTPQEALDNLKSEVEAGIIV